MVVWNTFQNDARVLKEAQTLQANGYDVLVHALHTPGLTEAEEILPDGVRVVRVTRAPLWRLRGLLRMRRRRKPEAATTKPTTTAPSAGAGPVAPSRMGFVRRMLWINMRLATHARLLAAMVKSRPQIVHAHDANTLVTGWLASKCARAKFVYDAHEISTSREGYQDFKRLVGRMERCLMPRASASITTTSRRAAFFRRAYGVPRPLVLQNRPRTMPQIRTNRIREELRIIGDRPIVLYQGGLQPGRGLNRVVDAAAAVDNAIFVFIGGGRSAPDLEQQVKALGIGDRVRFIPTVKLDELPEYTASADIGIQALENTCLNHSTTDSNKLFEYIMAGLPVIASNFPEIRRIVKVYDLGLLINPGDTQTLAHAITELVENSSLRDRLASNSKRASRELTWESQESDLLSMYGRLAAPGENST